jgi:beta-N-acetylhexosaminidase
VIATLSLRQRLAQLLMVGVSGDNPPQALDLVRTVQVGGIFLNGNGTALLSGGQLVKLAASAVPPMVGVDEEGGRVQRVDKLDGPIPSARVMASTMTPDQVRALASKRGAVLRARGVTVDFAPVADVTDQSDNSVIGDRSYGADPLTVTRYAGAFAAGLRAGGVLPVVKHFPGHGHASGDSHRSSVITPPLAAMTRSDLVPFDALLTTHPIAVMVGHMEVPGLTDGLPASLSAATYQLLRGQISFGGLAVTDDLGSMQAVTERYPLPDAVLTALTAGADMAMWSSGGHVTEVLDTLERAAEDGRLPAARIGDALNNVLRAKSLCTD